MNNFSENTGPSLPPPAVRLKELERAVGGLEAALQKLESENRVLDARNTDFLRRIEYYLRVINSMKDGYLVHKDGIIKDLNEQISEITGYQAHELLGRDVRDFMPVESHEIIQKQMLENSTAPYEIEATRKDGKRVTLELVGNFIEGINSRIVIIRDITEKKKTEKALNESEQIYRTIAEQAIAGIYTIVDGRIGFMNHLMPVITGYSKEEAMAWGHEEFLNIVHPDDREFVRDQARKKMRGDTEGIVKQYDFRIITKKGKVRWVTIFSKPVVINDRVVIISAMLDITDRKTAEIKIRESEERFRVLADSPFQGMFIHDNIGIIFANRVFFGLVGLDQDNPRDLEKVYGVNALRFVAPEYRARVQEDIRTSTGEPYEVRVLRHDGTPFYAELQSSVTVLNGVAMRVFAVRDITEKKRIEFNEIHDKLTGLLNEKGFISRITDAITHGAPFDVMEIELDGDDLNRIRNIQVDEKYKSIGNELQEYIISDIAGTLKNRIFPGSAIARNGRRFYLLLYENDGPSYSTSAIIDRALGIFPFPLRGFSNEVAARISITSYPQDFDGSNPMKLINNCESAIQWARNNNIRFMVYNRSRDREVRMMYRLEQDLKTAVDRLRRGEVKNEFSVVYQPKVDKHDSIVGLEALIRWEHPDKGTIMPSEFITLAEHSGLIHELGRWVLFESCSRIGDFVRLKPDIVVSVNVSPQQLNARFISDLRSIIDSTSVNPHNIELEIIEREIVKDENIAILRRLHELGVTIAVDDFSEEHAALRQIALLADVIRTLKFSHTSIKFMMENQIFAFMVKGIIDLAHNFQAGVQVVAEGVDSKEKFERCIEIGFDQIQGFYRGREPRTFDEIMKLLA